MEKLNNIQLESIEGGTKAFWDGFCAGAGLFALMGGGANVVANVAAVGCVAYTIYNL